MGQDLRNYTPDDESYWNSTGKAIANRNLWISIPSLLCGFAVWLYWGIITVQMLNLGFPFEKSQLFTLSAIAGLTGATLRIPSTFFIRIAGGRNTIFFTTALLMIPAIGTGIALQDPNTPMWKFQVLAFLSGIGGGNFASSMSNISFFFPKRMQGAALGWNAGIGNLGVGLMQAGYRNSPLEEMAYALQADFDQGALPDDLVKRIQRKTDAVWNDVSSILAMD